MVQVQPGRVRHDVDAWLVHALAACRGHWRDPAVAGLPTPPVRARAAPLGELAATGEAVGTFAV
ncbi:hypothetical protein ACFQFR_38340 [Streptomyces goshikiensis]